jgi:hypothetical protein
LSRGSADGDAPRNDQTAAPPAARAGRAYARELAAELTKVEQAFGRWRSGEIGPFDVEAVIHRFHQGPARKLFTRYQRDPDWAVSLAIIRGIRLLVRV